MKRPTTRSSASSGKRVTLTAKQAAWPAAGRTRPSVMTARQVVGRVNRLLAGKNAGGVQIRAGASAPPIGRGTGAALAGVQQGRPGNGLWQSGHVAEHDLDDVPDRIGGIFGPAGAFQSSIDEELKQIEGEGPKQQYGQ